MDPHDYPLETITPGQALQLVADFAILACQQGIPQLDITIRNGLFDWNKRLTTQDPPNFIVTLKSSKIAMGLSSKQWNKLQAILAIAIARDNKPTLESQSPRKENPHVHPGLAYPNS